MRDGRPGQPAKVFYRPIEAAIRWSELTRFESRILAVVGSQNLPNTGDFPRWPHLRLNGERIFDALRNGELPYGKAGVTHNDPSLLDDPDLTVRHVDLRVWMSRFYPDQRPSFLFDAVERQLCPTIGIDAVQALLADREALKIRLAELERSLEILQERDRLLCKEAEGRSIVDREVSPRSEATYLGMIGGLLNLLLGRSPSGKRYSSFETVESVISALLAHHPGRPGLSERTLWAKFTAAKRHMNADY
jgi:hypothetical protein